MGRAGDSGGSRTTQTAELTFAIYSRWRTNRVLSMKLC